MTTAGMIWTGFQSVRFWRWSMWIIWCHVCRSEDLWPKTSDCWSSPSPHNPVHQGNVHTGFNRSWWSLLANDHQNNMPLFSMLFPPLFSHWYFFFICLMVSPPSAGPFMPVMAENPTEPLHPPSPLGKESGKERIFLLYFIVLYKQHSCTIITIHRLWFLKSSVHIIPHQLPHPDHFRIHEVEIISS